MKHISILIPRGDYSVVNIMGCRQMLAAASHRHKMQSGKDLFCIDLVGFFATDGRLGRKWQKNKGTTVTTERGTE